MCIPAPTAGGVNQSGGPCSVALMPLGSNTANPTATCLSRTVAVTVAGLALLGAVKVVPFPLVGDTLPAVAVHWLSQKVLVDSAGSNERPTRSPTPRSVRVVSPKIRSEEHTSELQS